MSTRLRGQEMPLPCWTYRLTDADMEEVAHVGYMRNHLLELRNESRIEPEAAHRFGVMGQLVFHRLTGLYWYRYHESEEALNEWRLTGAPNVGRTQVKTRSRSHWGLFIGPEDGPDKPEGVRLDATIVLVVPYRPDRLRNCFRCAGWATGRDVYRHWNRRAHGWVLDQPLLRPMPAGLTEPTEPN